MSEAILKVSGLKKSYKKRIIFDNAAFEIFPGDIVGIVGANGCGKSTLLRILAGADKPDGGLIEYGGHNAMKNPKIFREYAGYVPQDNPLFENLTVSDNLKLWYCDHTDELSDIMERFDLNRYAGYTVSRLSGGIKKRLSIACSLAGSPSILILDEPGASLDIVCKSDICSYLSDYSRNGGTVIITSHEECELSLCSRMFIINECSIKEIPPVSGAELMKLISKKENPNA